MKGKAHEVTLLYAAEKPFIVKFTLHGSTKDFSLCPARIPQCFQQPSAAFLAPPFCQFKKVKKWLNIEKALCQGVSQSGLLCSK